jgi:hypothetical protein
MARTKISEFSATPGDNTDIDGIDIAEGCAPSGINNAIRELMAQLKDMQTGASGDTFTLTTVNSTTVDTTNLEATNLKAKDGTAAGSIANTTGVVTLASSVLTTTDINGGTVDGTTIGATTPSTVVATQVDITAQGDLRLQDTTGGQYVALQAPSTIATSYTLTLPVDDGTSGQALITDGSGVLSWSSAASGDVYGPASATDNAVARFDLTTGKIIQDSVVTIADTTGNMAGVGTLGVGAITTSGALTYGGVTLNNAVTGTGNMVLSTSPTLVTPVLGTPASGTVTNLTGTASININGTVGATTAAAGTFTNLAYTGTLTGGTGVVNLGSGQVYKDASGNVGIGVTPFANTLSKSLDMVDGVGLFGLSNGTYLSANAYFDSNWKYKNTATAGLYTVLGGAHTWFTAPSGTAGNTISFTQAMTLNSSGNVGIGTISPASTAKLTVQGGGANGTGGTRLLSDTSFANGANYEAYGRRLDANGSGGFAPGVLLARVNTAPAAITSDMNLGRVAFGGSYDGTDANVVYGAQIAGYSSGTYSASSAATDIVFFTTPSGTAGGATSGTANFGTERMRLDSSGRLLVGTAAASNTNGVKITNGGAVGGGIIELMKTGSGITNGLLNYYQTTYVGGINFDNTSTSFPTSSDARLKKDIVDAPSATQKIDNIRIVSHGWKHDDAVVEFGVIAQELVSVAPNAVMQGDDGDEVVTTWSVDYSKLVPLLIKAHQEQQALIQDLTTRLTALEAI